MSQSSADRNLLFGILAVRMDFVGRDDFIAAVNAWVLDKNKSLGQVLGERGVLPADRRALLEALVEEHLKRHGGDTERSLTAVSLDGSVRQDLAQVTDADVQASLARASATATGVDPAATGAYVPPAARAAGARFRILRPHARGGLGEVFVARDEELRREVALKEMQEAHAHHPDSRARFLLEAEVTGGLEHPGIVPVYGMGSYADGRPFYAMRFIRGDSLKEAVERFHKEKEALPAGERTLRLRGLLGRYVDVCQAVAYAHSRGVLHRDLKPANILLGPYGETLVVDWGLAKLIDRPDAPPVEGPLEAAFSGDAAKTQAGAALGTPAYMSPEQAAGRLDDLGPRSDVYSLGATLYCLLTGRPPFDEKDVRTVLDRVQRGDFPPPRRVNPQVPAALEAVVLKAMALRPEERYATPRDLADEVERFLADEPVRAHREPWTTRLARWARRHPRAVTAAAVSAVLLVVFAGLVYRLGTWAKGMQAEELVGGLETASPAELSFRLGRLDPARADVLACLRQKWQDGRLPDSRRLRVGLALARVEPGAREPLAHLAGRAEDPREVLAARDALRPFAAEVRDDLWGRAVRADVPPDERLRLLVLLAALDPDGPGWQQQARPAAELLLASNPLYLGAWAEALRPVRGAVLPPLAEVFRGRRQAEHRQLAAVVVADYAADRPDVLADLAPEADARQYAALLPRLKARAEEVRPLLRAELTCTLAAQATEAEKDALALRQANAAVTLLHLGEPGPVWPLLVHSDDPSRRTYLTHHLGPYGIDAGVLLDRLATEPDVSARRALLLSLGEYAPEQVPAPRRQELVARLVRDHHDDPDPGVHGAVEWLLRRWHEEANLPALRNHRPKDPPAGKPTWYANGRGQTFTVIRGPVEFRMGSPPSDPYGTLMEKPHRRKIPRSFALGTKEVTVAEFRDFLKANPALAKEFDAGGQAEDLLKRNSPHEDGPIVLVSWYQAAAYCNWLSRQEGLSEKEWCYPKDPGRLRPGMVLEEGYLRRQGYRLPTEAEWEFGCRAGAVTPRYYGRSLALLGHYAWFQENAGEHAHPVGRLRPNDLGLFDMLGNASEWCQDRAGPYPGENVEDAEDRDRSDPENHPLRGSGYIYHGVTLRAGMRYFDRPALRHFLVGFRVARTCPDGVAP
jgi:formylglycine-generating enzyme required for sulfatase activity